MEISRVYVIKLMCLLENLWAKLRRVCHTISYNISSGTHIKPTKYVRMARAYTDRAFKCHLVIVLRRATTNKYVVHVKTKTKTTYPSRIIKCNKYSNAVLLTKLLVLHSFPAARQSCSYIVCSHSLSPSPSMRYLF